MFLLCLRDDRFKIYKDALLGMVESSLFQGPIYLSLSDETKNFEKIIEQNNYSNTYLKVIGTKLDRIENKIDPIKLTTKLDIEKTFVHTI